MAGSGGGRQGRQVVLSGPSAVTLAHRWSRSRLVVRRRRCAEVRVLSAPLLWGGAPRNVLACLHRGDASAGRASSAAAGTFSLAPALASFHLSLLPPLMTAPPFMTNVTRSSSVTSFNGSPATAIRSAYEPAESSPTLPLRPNRSAAFTVAAWIACIGVIPQRTMCANCLAFQPWG